MRLLLLLILFPFFVACRAEKSLDDTLACVKEKDQAIRRQMAELTRAVTVDGRMELIDSLIVTSEQVERVDAGNMAVVDSILQNGLPKNLTADSYKTIWLVIDHSTLNKQVEYLPLIEQMATDGLISKDSHAILSDRVAMNQNRPQRYGSQSVQFGKNDKMQLYIYPVEQPEKLDSLRATVAMQPIAEYLKTLTQTTGIEAKFDPALSVEELNRLRSTATQDN